MPVRNINCPNCSMGEVSVAIHGDEEITKIESSRTRPVQGGYFERCPHCEEGIAIHTFQGAPVGQNVLSEHQIRSVLTDRMEERFDEMINRIETRERKLDNHKKEIKEREKEFDEKVEEVKREFQELDEVRVYWAGDMPSNDQKQTLENLPEIMGSQSIDNIFLFVPTSDNSEHTGVYSPVPPVVNPNNLFSNELVKVEASPNDAVVYKDWLITRTIGEYDGIVIYPRTHERGLNVFSATMSGGSVEEEELDVKMNYRAVKDAKSLIQEEIEEFRQTLEENLDYVMNP